MRPAPTVWTPRRAARLGFLVGLGWDAKSIAADVTIAATPNNAHRQIQRLGLSLRAALSAALPADAAAALDVAAEKRGLCRAALIDRLLRILAAEPALLDNVLDDGA